MQNKTKKKKILLGIGVLLAICLIIGVSYAYWRLTLHQLGRNEVTSGCLELVLSKEGDAINNSFSTNHPNLIIKKTQEKGN